MERRSWGLGCFDGYLYLCGVFMSSCYVRVVECIVGGYRSMGVFVTKGL